MKKIRISIFNTSDGRTVTTVDGHEVRDLKIERSGLTKGLLIISYSIEIRYADIVIQPLPPSS